MTDDLRSKLEAERVIVPNEACDGVYAIDPESAEHVARNHYEPQLEALRAENTALREQLAETRLALLRKGTMPSVLNATASVLSPSKPEKKEA